MSIPIIFIVIPLVFFVFLALSIGLSVGLRGRCGMTGGRGGYRRGGMILPLAMASQQQQNQRQGQVMYANSPQAPPSYGTQQRMGGAQQPGQPGTYPAMYPGQGPPGYGTDPGAVPPKQPPPGYAQATGPSYGGGHPADTAYPPPQSSSMPGVAN